MTDFNNDWLGILLGELLGRRVVKTGHRGESGSTGCLAPEYAAARGKFIE